MFSFTTDWLTDNFKLVCSSSDDEIMAVATSDVAVGETRTCNYRTPQLKEDSSESVIDVLL